MCVNFFIYERSFDDTMSSYLMQHFKEDLVSVPLVMLFISQDLVHCSTFLFSS